MWVFSPFPFGLIILNHLCVDRNKSGTMEACDICVDKNQDHKCRQTQVGRGKFYPHHFVLTQAGLDTFFLYSREVEDSVITFEKLVNNNNKATTTLLRNLLNVHLTIKARFVIRVILVQQKTGELRQNDPRQLLHKHEFFILTR